MDETYRGVVLGDTSRGDFSIKLAERLLPPIAKKKAVAILRSKIRCAFVLNRVVKVGQNWHMLYSTENTLFIYVPPGGIAWREANKLFNGCLIAYPMLQHLPKRATAYYMARLIRRRWYGK